MALNALCQTVPMIPCPVNQKGDVTLLHQGTLTLEEYKTSEFEALWQMYANIKLIPKQNVWLEETSWVSEYCPSSISYKDTA